MPLRDPIRLVVRISQHSGSDGLALDESPSNGWPHFHWRIAQLANASVNKYALVLAQFTVLAPLLH